MNKIIIIGYSGHSYVCIDSAFSSGIEIQGYFEEKLKEKNPYGLKFLGSEVEYDFSNLDPLVKLFVSVKEVIEPQLEPS